MPGSMKEIGCILMASGLSERYGRNKLLEPLDGRALILRTADSLRAAGFSPLAVTRSPEVAALTAEAGIRCITHEGPKKSDTIHIGLKNLEAGLKGFLFMPGDQPLVRPESLRKMAEQFFRCPERAVRLGFGDTAGSPVIFPAFLRDRLMAYDGDRGGLAVLQAEGIPRDTVQAAGAEELWDADTPARMEDIRAAYFRRQGKAAPEERKG